MSLTAEDITKKLAEKFDPQDIEWRIQQAGLPNGGQPWAMVVPYITNRAIQQRLDDVVPGKWQDEYKPSPCGQGYICGISIKIDGEWVTRWDGAIFENGNPIDPVKSALSNSEKRAGVKWGIGRYLYQLEAGFAKCMIVDKRSSTPQGWQFYQTPKNAPVEWSMAWQQPDLPDWALRGEDSTQYVEALKNSNSIDELKHYYSVSYKLAKSLNDLSLMEEIESIKGEKKVLFENQANEKQERQTQAFDNWLSSRVALALDNDIEVVKEAMIKALRNDISLKAIEFNQTKETAKQKLELKLKQEGK